MEPRENKDYAGLREKILRAHAEDLNIQLDSASRVWCVVTDIPMGAGFVCLVAMIDGSASMHFSSGGSVVGDAKQEKLRDAATKYTRMCYKSIPEMRIAQDFPLPAAGVVSFFLLTNNGVYTASARKEDLVSGQNILAPMFFAASDLIAQFR